MSDATKAVGNAPTKLVLDFGAQEETCKNITKAGDDLCQLFQQESDALADVKIELGKAEAELALGIYTQGLKMTGLKEFVEASVSADSNVNALRMKEAKLASRVAGIKLSLENVDRGYGLFKAWMLGQRPIGLQDR